MCAPSLSLRMDINTDCHRGYIDETSTITDKGRQDVRLPADPVWFNAMIEGRKLGCLAEIVSLAALATAQSQHPIHLRPHGFRAVADEARNIFACPVSDHIAELGALHAFCEAKKSADVDLWCRNRFLNRRVLENALRLRDNLVTVA